MNEKQPEASGIIATDAVVQSPQFALMPLSQAVARWPEDYRPFPRKALGMLHSGSYVKVIVVSVGEIVTPEAVWLLVRQLSPVRRTGKHIGEVRTMTGRSQYHGLGLGMMIYFQMDDVIDMQLNRVETS